MARLWIQRFSSPDETRHFVERGRVEILRVAGGVVRRGIYEPGWRWSRHVKPVAGTESCEELHCVYVLTGRMRVRMDDGQEAELAPGDYVTVPPGHDAWTVGEETCVVLEVTGFGAHAPAGRDESRERDEGREAPAARAPSAH